MGGGGGERGRGGKLLVEEARVGTWLILRITLFTVTFF